MNAWIASTSLVIRHIRVAEFIEEYENDTSQPEKLLRDFVCRKKLTLTAQSNHRCAVSRSLKAPVKYPGNLIESDQGKNLKAISYVVPFSV